MCPHLLRRPAFARHVLNAEVDQLLLTVIFEFAVCIAPFAVILIERAVGFPAHGPVLERHAAALTDQLSRRTQQRIDRNIEHPGKQLERLHIRRGLPFFPSRDRLTGHENLFRQLILRHFLFRSQTQQNILRFHMYHLLDRTLSQTGPTGKQPAVALRPAACAAASAGHRQDRRRIRPRR